MTYSREEFYRFHNGDAVSLEIWQANMAAHELSISLTKLRVSCAEITAGVNGFAL